EFLEHVRNRLHGDFDRGFFAAWADFTRIISKLTVNEIQQATPQQNEEENGKKPPDDESQAKIEDFIE
ncbi:MAG: hypothetical protein QW658_03540, partial [Candidatus Bathyarchaeia archaeon]